MEKLKFYLRLPTEHHASQKMKILKSKAAGHTYYAIYIDMLQIAAETEGLLYITPTLPHTDKTLAVVTGYRVQDVHEAVQALQELDLLEFLEDGAIYLPEAAQFTKSETPAAERMRRHRDRQREESNQIPEHTSGEPEKVAAAIIGTVHIKPKG